MTKGFLEPVSKIPMSMHEFKVLTCSDLERGTRDDGVRSESTSSPLPATKWSVSERPKAGLLKPRGRDVV